MKKRILAFALVCLMVVSMLPTSILAADATAKCPGGPEKDHTISNCDSIPVAHQDVNGCRPGYDLYRCLGCDKEFAANIEQSPEAHTWQTTKTVAVGCKNEGYEEQTCTLCAETQKINVQQALDHDYKVVSYNEDELPVKVCQNPKDGCVDEVRTLVEACDATYYDATNKEHTWVGRAPTVVVPPKDGNKNGSAEYICDGCGYKEINVLIKHTHVLTKTDAKAASCAPNANAEGGYGFIGYTKEFYTCSACNLHFWTEADAAEWKAISNEDYNGNIIAADTTHNWGKSPDGEEERNHTLADCGKEQNETIEKYCIDHNGWVVTEVEGGKYSHSVKVETDTDATCMMPGSFLKICSKCNKVLSDEENSILKWDEVANAATHAKPAEGSDEEEEWFATFKDSNDNKYTNTELRNNLKHGSWAFVDEYDFNNNGTIEDGEKSVAPTCDKTGWIIVKCTVCAEAASGNPDRAGKNNGTHYKPIELPARGHNIKTVTVEATCSDWGFTFQYCANHFTTPNANKVYDIADVNMACTMNTVISTVDANDEATGKITVKDSNNKTMDIAVQWKKGAHATDANKVVWTVVAQEIYGIADSVSYTSGVNSENHKKQETYSQLPTCTTDGAHSTNCYYGCAINLGITKDDKLSHHNYTCGDAFGCDKVPTVEYILSKDGTETDGWSTTKPANVTCDKGIWKRVKCAHCDAISQPTQVEEPLEFDATELWTMEDAVKYHGTLTFVENQIKATCTVNKVDIYKCATCENNIYIETKGSGTHIGYVGANAVANALAYANASVKSTVTPQPAPINFTDKVPATCKDNEYLDIMICVNCDELDRTQKKETANSATGHNFVAKEGVEPKILDERSSQGKLWSYAPATALVDGNYEIRVCTNACCGSFGDNTTKAYQVAKVVGNTYEIIKVNNADFTTDVNAAKGTAKIDARHKIAANWNTAVQATDSTCYVNGTKEYFTCKDSCCKANNETAYIGKKWTAANESATMYDEDIAKAGQDGSLYKSLRVHKYVKVTGAERTANCVDFGYMYYHCEYADCDANCDKGCEANCAEHTSYFIVAYVAPLSANGTHTESATQPDGKVDADPTCTTGGHDWVQCSVCGHVWDKEPAATGHKNAENEVLTTSCLNKDVSPRECVNTNHKTEVDGPKTIIITHDDADYYTAQHNDATCMEVEHNVFYCSACGTKDIVKLGTTTENDNFELKDDQSNIVVAPTATTQGTVCCQYGCGQTKPISGVQFSIEAINATKEGAAYTDATDVTIRVSIAGLPSAKLSMLQFSVRHEAGVVFNGVEAFYADNGFSVGTANTDLQDSTLVNVSLMTTANESVTITDEVAVIDLSFTVSAPDATAYDFSIVAGDKGMLVTDDEKTQYYLGYIDANSNSALDAGEVYATTSIDTVLLMDADKDGEITTFDARILYNTYTAVGGGYESCLDLDRDGKLTGNDLDLIIKFVTSNATVDDDAYLALVDRLPATPPQA